MAPEAQNPTPSDTPEKGQLQINLTSEINSYPIENARVRISYTGVPDSQLEELISSPALLAIFAIL